MARILFTWELGGGLGHMAPYPLLVDSLTKKGHEVTFVLKDLTRAELVFGGRGIRYVQAPVRTFPVKDPIRPTFTYAHILHNIGFNDLGALSGMVNGWRNLFELLQPDLIFFDHSPTALLASRAFDVKRITIGLGFFSPPDVYPLPNMRYWQKVDIDKLRQDEDRIIGMINQLLERLHLERIDCLAELFRVHATVLRTFKELDHYQDRKNTRYWGVWTGISGHQPEWPPGRGKRIFAYLKPSPVLPALLATLKQLGAPTLIYGDQIPPTLIQKFNTPSIHFASKPQDMEKISMQCDLAILNATHATTARLLLAGKPQLLLPLTLEQDLMARNVENLGAGINMAVRHRAKTGYMLEAILASESYSNAARDFSRRYADFNPHQQIDELTGLVEQILS